MTNLLAVVTACIVTNVTTTNNESGCKICSARPDTIPALYHFGNIISCAQYREPTEKTETTEVVEVLRIKIDPAQLRILGWVGGLIEGEQKRVLSKTVRRWVRREQWEEAK